MSIQTESRKALRELIDLLNEVDERWVGPEWNLATEADVFGAHRALLHLLEGGIAGMFEADPSRPEFRRIVSPSRKFTGDNGDAIYFDACISSDYGYVVRGSMHGAIYVSMTIECGTESGGLGTRTGGVLNDEMFDVEADGSFEIRIGGPERPRNWLPMDPEASRLTTRHYFEEQECAARNPARVPLMTIEALEGGPPPPAPSDASVSAGIRRAAQFVRSRTLEMLPMAETDQPPFVSRIPNQLPKPVKPGDFGLAAFDAAYSMAPYVIGPDDAIVMTGRWPDCRCANVCLWTRFQQTYDYSSRQVSLNRAQTGLEDDGSFRMILAHEDPGLPNWIDTEGRPFGIVFWRFMLPGTEDIETPQMEVVPFAELKG
jgi:hypothetical protein